MLIQESDLKTWTGYRHRDALINWLRAHKVPYWLGNGGMICVTAEAVNASLMQHQAKDDDNPIEF